MSEARSGSIAFRPRARLLKLIGEELISDEVVAITELVKNAHDADASIVTISFHGVEAEGGSICVSDDGCGMDLETLLGGWMEPAGSSKGAAGGRITRKSRRVLGEKGVGRFAADKLGSGLDLVSLKEGHKAEVRARFDWDRFDNDSDMLSEVKNRWELRPVGPDRKHGTVLTITGLRQRWTERSFRRLCTRLSRLRPPFRGRDSFAIQIESNEFPDYSGELKNGFLDQAPYQAKADFDGQGTLKLRLGGEKCLLHVGSALGHLACGPVRIRLHGFDLETESLSRIGPRNEVRAWLREWSGVSLYRDGFRVWPYGEPHDDWLRLDQRRVNNPVVRMSNNQIVGFVEISRDGNLDLLDQTNREGLVANQALGDLRRLIEHVLQLLETERQRVRHPSATARKEKRGRKRRVESKAAEALESFARLAKGETAAKLRRIALETRESLGREEEGRLRLMAGYNDLAAAGQVAANVGALMLGELDKAAKALVALRRRTARDETAKALVDAVDTIRQHLEALSGVATEGSHRRRAMDVVSESNEFVRLFSPSLGARGVAISMEHGSAHMARTEMNPVRFRQVLYLLLANSLDWIGRSESPRIAISVKVDGGYCEVEFGDNGPGVGRGFEARIFEPTFSLKNGGRGMGLTIAKGLVEEAAGSIDLLVDGRRRGAHFVVRLPRKRSRSTVHPV